MRRENRQAWQLGKRTGDALTALLVAALLVAAATAGDRAASRPRRRATPPDHFDKATNGTFFDDAFATLHGPRPAFATTPAAAAGEARGAPGLAASEGFRWSSLVSEETLTDEVKDRKAAVAAAVAKPSDFKGGGYDAAREAFSSIALAFGVIAAYDQEIRWKKDAATALDLFARAGVNCKVGTDQTFAESKARLEDLESMLEGGSPQGKPDREEDFRWSQVATRPALMGRLETAEEVIGAGMASRGDFDRAIEQILHDAEMVAVIGEAIHQPDFEYHDDDTYKGYAGAMRDAATKVRDACRKQDYDAARSAAGELKKSCDACHGDYRS